MGGRFGRHRSGSAKQNERICSEEDESNTSGRGEESERMHVRWESRRFPGGRNATSVHPLHPPPLSLFLLVLFSCFHSVRIWEEPKGEGRQDVVSLVM